jgi:hypothetical protein
MDSSPGLDKQHDEVISTLTASCAFVRLDIGIRCLGSSHSLTCNSDQQNNPSLTPWGHSQQATHALMNTALTSSPHPAASRRRLTAVPVQTSAPTRSRTASTSTALALFSAGPDGRATAGSAKACTLDINRHRSTSVCFEHVN